MPVNGNVEVGGLTYIGSATNIYISGTVNGSASINLSPASQISFGRDTAGSNSVNNQAITIGPVDSSSFSVLSNGQYNFGGNAIMIGAGALITTNPGSTGDNNLVIGTLAAALYNSGTTDSCFRNTVIGAQFTTAQGFRNIAVGNGAHTAGNNNVVIGDYAAVGGATFGGSHPTYTTSTVTKSVGIGQGANVQHNNSVAIGYTSTTTANNQIMLGTNAETVVATGSLDVRKGLFNSKDDLVLSASTGNIILSGVVNFTFVNDGATVQFQNATVRAGVLLNSSYIQANSVDGANKGWFNGGITAGAGSWYNNVPHVYYMADWNNTVPAFLIQGMYTLPKTTNYNVLFKDNGTHFVTNGASGPVQFIMQSSSLGNMNWFTATAAQTLTVTTLTGAFKGPGNLTGSTITVLAATGSNQFSSFQIVCYDGTNYLVRDVYGTVTVS